MTPSLLIANRGEIACRIIRTQFLPGAGRGTASRRWRGSGSAPPIPSMMKSFLRPLRPSAPSREPSLFLLLTRRREDAKSPHGRLHHCHAELVSASMPRCRSNSGNPALASNLAAWILKQVQDDGSISGALAFALDQAPLDPQIPPVRIRSLDQVDLPCTMPALQLFLARDGVVHPVEELGMDKADRAVSRGKAGRRARAMPPQARREVGRYSDIKRPAFLAGEDVGARVSFAGHVDSMDDGAAWMLKRVQHDGRETKRA